MEQAMREVAQLSAIREMAKGFLATVGKELKNISQFCPDGTVSMPAGVYPHAKGRYALLTPDGLVEVRKGDYILQTMDNQFYYIRLEIVE